MEHKTIEELVKGYFKPVDNIPRDYQNEVEIIKEHKLSLMLESIIRSDYLGKFLKHENWSNGSNLKLPEPIIIKKQIHGKIISLHVNKFIVNPKKEDNMYNLEYKNDLLHLFISNKLCDYFQVDNKSHNFKCSNDGCLACEVFLSPWYVANSYKYQSKLLPPDLPILNIPVQKMFQEAVDKFNNMTLWDLFKPLTQFDSYDKVCRFIDFTEKELFEVAQKNKLYKKESFYDFDNDDETAINNLKRNNPNWSEETIIEFLLNQRISLKDNGMVNKTFQKTYTAGYQPVLEFDDSSIPKCIVTKVFNPANQTKSLIPITCWSKNKASVFKNFCIPAEDITKKLTIKQVGEKEDIVLVDSYDLLSLNWNSLGDKISLASYWNQNYNEVDFSKLKEYQNVYILLSNNSGNSFEEACQKVKRLGEYITENFEVNLKYIQADVEYPQSSAVSFQNAGGVENFYQANPPRLLPESVKILNQDDFNQLYKKVLNRLVPIWAIENVNEEAVNNETDKESKGNGLPDFLLRPAITRGEVVMLQAPRKHCKTVFTYSLCASIVSGERVFHDKWWTVPEGKHDLNKVLYLDFETGKERYKALKKKFIQPYFPSKQEPRQRSEDNFIHFDLKNDSMNYSEPANFQKIYDYIEEAKSKGIKGQAVDLLVIDNYSNFVKNENISKWSEIEPLLNKITSQGTAVLIVHHADEKGKAKGFGNKMRSLAGEIVITMDKEDEKNKNAEDFRNIELCNNRDSHIGIDNRKFKMNFDKKWKAYNADKKEVDGKYVPCDSNQEFFKITEDYKDNSYSRDTVLKVMRIKKSQYSKIRSDAQKNGKR